jgi:hypothetical protein
MFKTKILKVEVLNNLPIYNTEQTAEEIKTQYLFESVGKKQ